jgi:phosphatidate cytidylyltransferase
MKCYHEIITIGYHVYKSDNLPWFRSLSWYFLIAANYYLYGESLIEKFSSIVLNERYNNLAPFIAYHRFISFCLYCSGFVAFILSLRRTYYLKQFTLFGYTHMALIITVISSNLMIHNAFQGIIWFLIPVAIININDISAYFFGIFFGKTMLIKLSPKKTWEGFIGAAFSTLILNFILTSLLYSYKEMICPLEYDIESGSFSINSCAPSVQFIDKPYDIPFLFKRISMPPFQVHSAAFALFGSTIGPFGGFFASGFKRAFKIKDFAQTIPGHGGFMDRFDCQIIMATFVNVYMHSFVTNSTISPKRLFNQLLSLSSEDQRMFIDLLNNKDW